VGRHLVAEGRWSEAEALFAVFDKGAARPLAEAAAVGMIRVRIGQRRLPAAARLIADYWRRFPNSALQGEVRRLQADLRSAQSDPSD